MPRSSSSFNFAWSGEAIINRLVPPSVWLFGSSPPSSRDFNCVALPKSAVRIQDFSPLGSNSASVGGVAGFAASGSASIRAIAA
jgi:hypothetical protein